MKKIFWLFVAIIPQVGIAQTTDTFSDENFSANPVWQGTVDKFGINQLGQLQLNDNIASTAYLSTAFATSSLDNYEWRFYIKMTFSPSGTNYGRVYLTSDSEDLTGPLNGYYLQFGEGGSNDAVQLFRQTELMSTSICRATDGQIASSFELWIRVNRDKAANWQLLIATSEDADYVLEASGNDATYTSSAFIGVRCTYTASNSNKFFFDDFFAGDPLFDNISPELIQAEATSQNTLQLTFSEKLTTTSANNTSNYLLNNMLTPTSATLLPDEETVELVFSEGFDNASTNLLSIQGLLDLAGNEMNADEIEFFFFQQEVIQNRDIIFSEIMADPSPPQTLPEAEFIEIFNRSNKVINLNNVKFIDSSTEILLPEYFLFPNAYVLLTSNTSAQLFNSIENVVGIIGFPTLTNAGELLLLKDLNDQTIDSLQYDDDWYKDDDKKGGGFSLERINQHNFCLEDAENWQTTIAEGGGTPGTQNTVLNNTPDTEPPYVTSITVESNNVIKVYFSESLDEDLPNTTQFLIQPNVIIESLSFDNDERNAIEIYCQEPLQPSVMYNLKTSDVKDCTGNTAASLLDAGSFVLAEEASFQEVIITELLPDPSPVVGLPEIEFIELYNRSNKTINLKKFKITDGSSVGIIPDYTLAPNQYVLLLPEMAINQYGENILNKVGVKNFPTLNNSGETISLFDSIGQKIDSISYNLDWYHNEDKQSGGWSLERKDINNFCFESENWSASIITAGGTPGDQNSVHVLMLDNEAPKLISVLAENANQLKLFFNERLSEDIIQEIAISIEPNLEIEQLSFASEALNEIELNLSHTLLNGGIYTISVLGGRDCSGNLMAEETTLNFGLPTTATRQDVVINEIMFDPSPPQGLPEIEYIELFNGSDKLFDLADWTLKDSGAPIVLSSKMFFPGEFLIICSSQNAQYFPDTIKVLTLNNFPSLSNTGESIVIKNSSGDLIDSINYKVSWYNNEEAMDGGRSLERIDIHNNCSEEKNWRASTQDIGGTPGFENAVKGILLDNQSPELLSVIAENETLLKVLFNEKLSQDFLFESTITINPQVIIESVDFLSEDLDEVGVFLTQPLTPGEVYEIILSGGSDCSGNAILEEIISPAFGLSGEVVSGDIIISEIMADPTPSQGLPEVEYLEIFNRSSKLINLDNWVLKNKDQPLYLPEKIILPESWMIICSAENAQKFLNASDVLALPNFTSLSNTGQSISIINENGLLIDSLNYSITWYASEEKKDGGWSLERIDVNNFCLEADNWKASVSDSGGTPGAQNSVLNNTLDTEPPFVTSIAVESSNVIKVHFSEKLFEELPNATQFLIQPAAIIGNLSFTNAERNSIDIIFHEALQSGINYSLKTSDVKDCPGNASALLLDAGSFVLAEEASFQDIIITEILPDPSPVVGLPEIEFIELYNRSNKTINLNKFKITDGSSVGIIPDFILGPSQYVLLLPETAIHQYHENILNKVAIKNYPTLNNTGETISLLDSADQKIDSIRFNLEWYHDEDKQSGGWSLERMDLNNFCFEKENWSASIATIGGTPGFQNTVYTTILDNTAPVLSSVFAENDNTLLLSFNEKLHENNLSQLEIWIEPSHEIQSMSVSSSGYNEIKLILAQPLLAGGIYKLYLHGARDCSGNVMLSENISQPFGISSQAIWKDIIINEVMADPSPARTLPEAEYIEILNRSDKLINLHNWTIKDNDSPISLASKTILPDSFLILCSTQHAQFFSQHGETLTLNAFPSLSNSGESITLRNAEGALIDSINYRDTWYLDADKKDGGWSLELIDKQNICSEETNWAASENEAGGTPGKENSIAGAKPDLMGPILVEAILISPDILQMNFNEKLDKTIPSVNAFVIDPELDISAIQFTDNTLRSLTVSFSTPAEENILYNLEITQLFDCAGNGIQGDHKQTTFVLPQQANTGDLIINEVLFNPLSGGVDFVEVLNVSNKYINLKNWKLTNLENDEIINERKITPANTVLHPNSYMVFTSDKEQLLNHYPQGIKDTFIETNLPSLPDDEGSIALADSLYNILDYFLYSESMHSKLLKNLEGVSLERISTTGNTDDPAMWRSGVIATGFATPGYKNANLRETFALTDEVKVDPEIFEPIYGQPNYTSISYKFNQGGYAANAKIYDAQGRLVKTLTNNEVLASEGFMTWDGDQDDGTKAHIGYYTLWLEVFDNTGFVKTFRKRVVVATRF